MRLCCPPHAFIKESKLKQPFGRFPSRSSRLLHATVSREYPQFPTRVQSDVPPYQPQLHPNPKARNVAVVGGGITGLAAAYNLSKVLPNANVTLFEAKKKLGGWLDSDVVPVDGGEVLFEWGPRTLRNDGFGAGRYTAQLISQLNMAEDVIPTSGKSSAARNRYVYYPDHLVRMPGLQPDVGIFTSVLRNVKTVLQEPIFDGAIRGIYLEPSNPIRPESMQDESVGDFVTRRFGRVVADNLVSALLHGIYAGDLYKLSARTILPLFWHLESLSKGGIIGALGDLMWKGESLIPAEDVQFTVQSDNTTEVPRASANAVAKRLQGASVYTFKKGLAQLAERTEAALRESKNVEIKTMTAALAFNAKTKQFRITDADKQNTAPETKSNQYDYVVSTLSPSQLSRALEQPGTTPTSPFTTMLNHLRTSTSTVNVMVVNLFYRSPNLLPITGFGYLLPRAIPLDQNPERALGVIFGSETSRASLATNDNSPPPPDPNNPNSNSNDSISQDSVPGTKLTVMLGGHWWSTWSPSDLPSESTAIEMATSVLHRHLGITATPAVAKARMQWNAIPQYEVGHHGRMATLHGDLKREFAGRLKVAGSAWHGVGVNDCVKAARKASLDVREGFDERTGLEGFVGLGKEWAVYRQREGTVVLGGRGTGEEG